jgi:hypothetical protein
VPSCTEPSPLLWHYCSQYYHYRYLGSTSDRTEMYHGSEQEVRDDINTAKDNPSVRCREDMSRDFALSRRRATMSRPLCFAFAFVLSHHSSYFDPSIHSIHLFFTTNHHRNSRASGPPTQRQGTSTRRTA